MTSRSFSTVVLAGGLFCLLGTPVLAQDARSLALGGSSIANGQGIQGSMANPSALMRYKREGRKGHLHMGAYADFRDDAELYETVKDEEDLIDDLDAEIDRISDSTLTCNFFTASDDTECLSGTQLLGDLSARVLDVVNTADGESLTANASAVLGAGYTQWNIPVAFFVKASATGAGSPDIADGDKDYISTFVDVLSDDILTFGELQDSVPLDYDENNQTLQVTPPEDVFESDAQTSDLLRVQFGISIATSLAFGSQAFDIGITPKFSTLTASSVLAVAADAFEEDPFSLEDQREANQVEETSFTADIGVTTVLPKHAVRLSAVARNIIGEKIETNERFVFETTPQLIVGASVPFKAIRLNADIALNKAKVDNFETQLMSLGIEFQKRVFGLRAGVTHDTARTNNNTGVTAGANLGPLHLGARLSSKTIQAGVDLAWSF
jgi:hypothetical protein